MAEDSWMWTTDGTGDGTDAGYTQAEMGQFWRYMFTQDPTTECVVAGALNELAVTGATSPVSMATGYAVVDGIPYKNDAAKDIAIATPVVGTTGHRVVLTADWTDQEVRQELLSSADGTAAIPSPTQTSGTDYDVSLCTLTITTGGDITVTDTRGFCHFGTDVETSMIEDDAVDSDQIAAGAIDLAHMSVESIDSDQYVDASIDLAHMSVESVDSDQYVDASIDLAHLAANSVDDTKVGNRVPALTRRQGGNATDWQEPGTTTYTPTNVRIQCGSATIAAGAGTTLTFPVAFSAKPIAVASSPDAGCSVLDTTATTVKIANVSGAAETYWIAIGPE